MNQEQKNLLRDTLRTPGWALLEALIKQSSDGYRKLATQAPGEVTENLRTWYSAKAEGREEVLEEVRQLLATPLDENTV